MRIRSNVVVLLSSLVLVACGGSKQEAKGPEGDPWADYKGTYATPGAGSKSKSAEAKADKATEPKVTESKAKVEKPAEPAKKLSKGTIKGESVSSIGAETLASASKAALSTKVVSSKTVVGQIYEQVQVELKGGVRVEITRLAAAPDPDGPNIPAPRVRHGELRKNESGWMDEDADVLVVVGAGKKKGAAAALGRVLKR